MQIEGKTFRLTICPRCEYSLEGLPDEGICPECGGAYDRSMFIVRCAGMAQQRVHPNVLLAIGLATGAITVWIATSSPVILRTMPQLTLMCGFLAAICGIAYLDRILSPRGGAWLLWLTPTGIGVQADFDPDSMLAKSRKWVMLLWWPLYVGAGFIPMIMTGLWIFPLIFGTIMVAAMITAQVFSRTKFDVPPADGRPGLVAWNRIARILWKPLSRDRYRVVALVKYWFGFRPVAYVTFQATREYAELVKGHIEHLAGREVKVLKFGEWR